MCVRSVTRHCLNFCNALASSTWPQTAALSPDASQAIYEGGVSREALKARMSDEHNCSETAPLWCMRFMQCSCVNPM